MADKLPPIYFYIPQEDWSPSKIPKSANTYWSGFEGNLTSGIYAWTVQTYLRLKEQGFPCQLTGTLPKAGIVLAHRASLPFHLRPKPKLLFVCLQADYDPHPYAQLHIVLNADEARTKKDSYYMPHWPQPGLIPRAPERGARFENVAYFGIEKNLAPELQEASWPEQLAALGLRWLVASRDRWNDFSDVDAILAVRSFESLDYKRKPATKLYNSWHAGVPAILGPESAYRAELLSELDYLEVTSAKEAIEVLGRLRSDPELRRAMVENGRARAEETEPAKLVSRWREFITDVAVPACDRWCGSSMLTQKLYLARRYLVVKENNLKPHPIYPHDRDIPESEGMGSLDWGVIAGMQLYRKVRRRFR